MMYVYSFYKFIELDNLSKLRNAIYKRLDKLNIKGTILVSHEGINVNISQEKASLLYEQKLHSEIIKITKKLLFDK